MKTIAQDTDTKTALLDSAEHAVRSHGYDGFSYADLAADIGIRKASIHYHFPTKANLGLELMKRYNMTLSAWLDQTNQHHASAAHRLRAQVKRYRDALSGGNELCLCVAFSISRDHLDGDVINEINDYRSKSIDWLTAVFQLGKTDATISNVGDPQVEARACLATLEGAHLAARSAQSTQPYDDALQLLNERTG